MLPAGEPTRQRQAAEARVQVEDRRVFGSGHACTSKDDGWSVERMRTSTIATASFSGVSYLASGKSTTDHVLSATF